MGCTRVERVNGPDELPQDMAGVIGVTAGASAPEELVQAVVERLAPRRGVTLVNVLDEDEYFPPPPQLRRVLDGAIAILAIALGVPSLQLSILADDRHLMAADVLHTLVAT